jgi:hypothetical protein
MKKYMTLKNGVGAVLVLWLVFSIGYIVRDQFLRYHLTRVNQAFQAGVSDSVNKLIAQSEECEPISVFADEKEVNLIAIECLQPPTTEEDNQNSNK